MRGNESLVQRCYFLTFITEDIDQVRHIYIIACSLIAILILPTIVLNILLIISLYRSPQLSTKPSTKLLYSLAISDVLVGIVIEPLYVAKKVAELQHRFELYCYAGMTTYIGGGALANISFFNLSAIAIDRYLAVHSGTKYQTMVTNSRVACLIIAIWTSSLTLHSSQFLVTRSLYFITGASIMITGVAIASISYIKCVITLRKQKMRINRLFWNSAHQKGRQQIQRYRRSTYTMLYMFLIFNLCYLPYFSTAVSAGILGESAAIWGAESMSVVIIYANSFLNPIILFWRMKELGNTVIKTIRTDYFAGESKSFHDRKTGDRPNKSPNENIELENMSKVGQ